MAGNGPAKSQVMPITCSRAAAVDGSDIASDGTAVQNGCLKGLSAVSELLENRLRPSSQSTITTAWNVWWVPYCDFYFLPYFISSGSASRAGVMAGFVLYMIEKERLRYGTIGGYVWAVCDKHMSNGYANPLSNVRDWAPFMHSVEVEIHVPTEPRKMVPWLLFIQSIPKANTNSVVEMATVVLMLLLFFLISRPELVPSAAAGFETAKHLSRKCVRWDKGYLECLMRGIKQDPLCKRPGTVAGEAWRAIGNATAGVLDTLGMLKHYLSLVTFSSDDSPLLQNDSGGPLTYSKANAIMRMLFRRAGATFAQAASYAMGGIRVLARNAVAGVAGDQTAKIQGGWLACDVYYDRPMLMRILSLPSRMAEFCMSASMPTGGVLEAMGSASSFLQQVDPPLITHIREGTSAPSRKRKPVSPAADETLPAGWTVTRAPSGGATYANLDGRKFRSLVAVRRSLSEDSGLDPESLNFLEAPAPVFMSDVVVENDRPSKRRAPRVR